MPFDNNDRGGLWPREKKSPKQPDMGGEFTLSKETIQYLVSCVAQNKEAKIEVSAWRKEVSGKSPFLSCAVKIPFADRQGMQSAPTQRPEPQPVASGQATSQSYGESIAETPPWNKGGDPLPKDPWE